ncbi:chemotaxis protein CheA [Ohtaekwangia koreensis]|uniref:Chemotaxis protein CheA n=1 Tax=Ohtaekwangia koreensis TaxID=688867 RepID=A0A1T5LCC8_9BACT|nr:chemotaxis protein CheA [Ohtaekwangia koreensis]SKC73058.1 two-component system, chemotaxis family, sensor kinase CheA [Ohtaekwangia koreensis]
MDNNQKRFIEDTLDLLNELDEGLLQLESNPLAIAPLEQVFRTMHTIKGAASMFGFENISRLAHLLETLFDKVRQGHLPVSDNLISLTLQAFDRVRDLLGKKNKGDTTQSDNLDIHLALASQFLKDVEYAAATAIGLSTGYNKNSLATYLLQVKPTIGISEQENHPLIFIVKDLEALGTIKTHQYKDDEGYITDWSVVIATSIPRSEIESYFIFVEHECEILLEQLADGNLLQEVEFKKAVDDYHQGSARNPEELKICASWLSEKSTSARKQNTVVEDAGIQRKSKTQDDTVIKVSKHKIDDLINWISELIILQAQLLNIAQRDRIAALDEITERMETVTNHLRDTSLEIGLVPIEALVTKFKRLVRDLSKQQGKKINFLSKGTETEMDKDVIEMMTAPIMHLIRNAIDHGVETPEERSLAGKPEYGTIKLKAYRSNTFINLVVSDDGKGIDTRKVLQKATERGVIKPDDELTEQEIFNLIFCSSLSTAEVISDVSGRGVGMDVVNQRITELRGSILISSTEGKGTSFHIKLPLSRSIIDGLLVLVDTTHYVIPLNVIERIDRIPYTSLDRENHVCVDVLVNEELLPVFSLRKKFYSTAIPPKTTDIISVGFNGVTKGIAVDSIQGKIQAVLKPLGEHYQQVDFISGGTILGDGTMALVLDPQRLFKESIFVN